MFDLPYLGRQSLVSEAARDGENIPESCDELRGTHAYGGAGADARSKIGRGLRLRLLAQWKSIQHCEEEGANTRLIS
jgi:hypothetical protein